MLNNYVLGVVILMTISVMFLYALGFCFVDLLECVAIIFIVAFLLYHEKDIETPRIHGGHKPDKKFSKMELMDPKHNFREVAKQLILLEDHMSYKEKRCVDCITKHYLMVEALLEEAIMLDKDGNYKNEAETALRIIRDKMMNVISAIKNDKINDEIYQQTCQELRKVRKELANKYVLYL